MDGDTTKGERLKQEELGDRGHPASFLPWDRGSRNAADELRGKWRGIRGWRWSGGERARVRDEVKDSPRLEAEWREAG